MSFQSKDLSVLAYANGFTLWHYATADQEIGAGYFNTAADMLRVGDMIFANLNHDRFLDTDGEPAASVLLVTANNGGNVKTMNMATTLATASAVAAE